MSGKGLELTRIIPKTAHYYGFDYVNPKQDPTEYQAYGDKGVDFLTDEAEIPGLNPDFDLSKWDMRER